MKIDNINPKKTKRRTLTVSRLKKVEILKKMMRARARLHFFNANSIRAIFLRCKV